MCQDKQVNQVNSITILRSGKQIDKRVLMRDQFVGTQNEPPSDLSLSSPSDSSLSCSLNPDQSKELVVSNSENSIDSPPKESAPK